MTQGRVTNAESRGVLRAVATLQALSQRGVSTALGLHRMTGIPRTAIYRILSGLIQAGVVSHGRLRHTFVLTSRVRTLSSGYRVEDLIAEIATPLLNDLQKRVVWPTELATLSRGRMLLRDTTRQSSPMVIDGEVVGRDIPILGTALGLAFLSACTPGRRKLIIEQIRAHGSEKDLTITERSLQQFMLRIHKRGYAWRNAGVLEGRKYHTSSIAIPIIARSDARAAIGITFIGSALSPEQAAEKYLHELRVTGQLMAARLEATEDLGLLVD